MYQTTEATPGTTFGDQEVVEAYKLIVNEVSDPVQHQSDIQDFLNALLVLPNRVAYIRRINTFFTGREGVYSPKLATEISYTLVGSSGLLP